jgi:nitrogen fixation protein FixH
MSASHPLANLPDERRGRTVRPPRLVTGRTVLAWISGFFGVIFAANAALIYLAFSSFPGLEVASSYQAGQQFNNEIQAAAEQASRGWQVEVGAARIGADARLTAVFAGSTGAPERELAVLVALSHPTDTRHDRRATLVETSPGFYTADIKDIAAGGWTLVVEAEADGQRVFRSRNPISIGP